MIKPLQLYIAIEKQMFFVEGAETRPVRVPALVSCVVGIAMVAVIAVGLAPDLFATFPPSATLP